MTLCRVESRQIRENCYMFRYLTKTPNRTKVCCFHVVFAQIARVYAVSSLASEPVSEFVLDLAHSDQNKQQQMVATQGRKAKKKKKKKK
jgi:hypothetical protein